MSRRSKKPRFPQENAAAKRRNDGHYIKCGVGSQVSLPKFLKILHIRPQLQFSLLLFMHKYPILTSCHSAVMGARDINEIRSQSNDRVSTLMRCDDFDRVDDPFCTDGVWVRRLNSLAVSHRRGKAGRGLQRASSSGGFPLTLARSERTGADVGAERGNRPFS